MNIKTILLGFISLTSTAVQAGTPVWTFKPLTPTTLNVASNEIAEVKYRITNQSHKPHLLQMKKIQGVFQVTRGGSICGSSFNLPSIGTSCVLFLRIHGDKLTGPISDGPIVCEQGSINQCYKPSPANLLHITLKPVNNQATLQVFGSPLILKISGSDLTGAKGFLTIKNVSNTITARNIDSDLFGTALHGKVEQVQSSCTTALPPQKSCPIEYRAKVVETIPATSFTIQGDNTNAAQAKIGIVQGPPGGGGIQQGPTTGGTEVTFFIPDIKSLGVTSVLFGISKAPSFRFDSSGNVIIVTTPAHPPGTVDVTIKTSGGSTFTVHPGFIYVASSPPTIKNIQPQSGPVLGGTNVTLTGTNLDIKGLQVLFGGLQATNINVISNTTITVVTPRSPFTGPFPVKITTPLQGDFTVMNGYTYVINAIGQQSSGGIIACLNNYLIAGDLGVYGYLIATINSSPDSFIWGQVGLVTNATALRNGAANTQLIVKQGGTTAASYCSGLEVDSQGNTPCKLGNKCYTDWYLPAKNQLLCIQANLRNTVLAWSSTEVDASNAWATTATQVIGSNKSILRGVRCVRSFSK